MPFIFFCVICCMKVCLFASTSTFDSKSRKHLPAHLLNPMIWLPDGQGAKGLGKQVYASETHSCIASLLSICHHWGGEHRCHSILYLLIFLVVCNLGSIYSHIECLPPLRSLWFRPQGLASYKSCWMQLALTYTLDPFRPASCHNTQHYHPTLHTPR